MTIVLSVLGVAFAALCVWLGVRIVNRRERWAKRTAVALAALPMLYVLSFGPACWCLSKPCEIQLIPNMTVRRSPFPYGLIGWASRRAPRPLAIAIGWYATLMIERREAIYCGMDGIDDDGVIFWGPLIN